MEEQLKNNKFRKRLHEFVFEADTIAGRLFDIVLLALIVISVIVVILESIEPLHKRYGALFLFLPSFSRWSMACGCTA